MELTIISCWHAYLFGLLLSLFDQQIIPQRQTIWVHGVYAVWIHLH